MNWGPQSKNIGVYSQDMEVDKAVQNVSLALAAHPLARDDDAGRTQGSHRVEDGCCVAKNLEGLVRTFVASVST